MSDYKVIIVEGLIGAGKSQLSQELAKALGPETLLLMEPDEQNEANPYLAMFYENKVRWAFTMQIHLLSARFGMHEEAQWHVMNGRGDAVLDRSFMGDTSFARLQLNRGDMSPVEFDTYRQLYHRMTANVLLPNVCIRLLVSPKTSAERIQKRLEEREGRKCESVIDLHYLEELDQEILHMTDVLRKQGVLVLDVPWDVERRSPSARDQAVQGIAAVIRAHKPPDLFLDLHRRTT